MALNEAATLSRRTFVKGSLAGLALAGAAGGALYGCSPKSEGDTKKDGGAATANDEIVWSQCNVNCGGRCVFQWHVKDGKIAYMETDNTGEPEGLQARACLRGRSMRRWVNHPDRLMKPMKRVGKRGENKFEEISWDEAIDTIATKLKDVIEKYGNEAVYINYATGMYSATGKTTARLMNVLGGYLGSYADYSTNMMSVAMPYMYGEECTPYDSVYASSASEAEKSDLVLMFGNSPADTRMGGANAVWDFTKVREAGAKIYHIDYRLNETASGHPEEWIPIRTGTDAALVAAIAHELIANDQVDVDFLHTYCVGFDEETMPESAKGQNKSYKDYIMGTGYDMVEKTPEWAAPITQIPAERIRSLAAELAAAKAPFVVQGWGPQRHTNGENTARAICLLPCLLGKVGLPGTNTGMREAEPSALVGGIPNGKNPVKASINVYQWLNAVDHGEQMTAKNAGVHGVDQLTTGIKFLWNYAGNCITNQHADINKVHEILQDETKCECIVVTDTVMTDSAKYADILLPDAMRAEQLNMSTNGYSEFYLGVCIGGPAQEAPGECRPSYDVNAAIADKFGKKDDYTEGRTQEEWVQYLYEEGAKADGDMPSWDDIQKQGLYKRELEPVVGLKDFRDDPAKNALKTPSGKIEIYSEELEKLAAEWELEEGDAITPIPSFLPGYEGYGSVTEEFPLYCSGFHYKSRTHSSFGFIEELNQACRQQLWINPLDAESRGISHGDLCSVTSPVGEITIEAKVTSRIVPGTIGIPQGAWHDADMQGDRVDKGGCVNTLTTYRPSPLAKGNGVHSIIAQVAKA
ncbi:DMSO/selenate family reductase complex A subunit [Gordonibacter massiliensis (ex Traore et al. 2017)]|uniref:DMSO/selenate family reductase complex A subunit n=1 Tax=Gordonibacter massiliensis (ex Traore et al. 2017) TaxID=1841863 RepID=UPI001C8B669C|nr:DMSO/selenate family reductase complex A subunit [Gordonibacter massiliensis (ex Traore et al. 2017)]MBX9034923.1 molybdopterin-dependent oxidoreductase [Gordonibacter massiliensis (ex Traore et al. 2017)]